MVNQQIYNELISQREVQTCQINRVFTLKGLFEINPFSLKQTRLLTLKSKQWEMKIIRSVFEEQFEKGGELFVILTESAHWDNSVYKLRCLSACVCATCPPPVPPQWIEMKISSQRGSSLNS